MDFSWRSLVSRTGILSGLIFFFLLIGLQVYFFFSQRIETERSYQMIAHTNSVIHQIEQLLIKVKEAESSLRGYVITGDESFLEYRAKNTASEKKANFNQQDINTILNSLFSLTSDNPVQHENLNALRTVLQKKTDLLEIVLDNYRIQGKNYALINGGKNRGKELMHDIQAITSKMIAIELNLLNQRQDTYHRNELNFSIYLIVAALITYSILLMKISFIIINFNKIRKAEQEIQIKDSYFRAAAEAGTDALFIFKTLRDSRNNVIDLYLEYLNPVGEKLLQIKGESIFYMPIEQVIQDYSGDGNLSRDVVLHVLQSRKPYENEYYCNKGHSAGRYFQQQIIPLADGVAISNRDITERKNMERMKNEFVSTVSHELRTPLTSIRGSLGLITGGLAGPISEQAGSLLNIAYNNCERLVRLINDILDIEKIESGHVVFETRPLSLSLLLQQAVEVNQAFADKYGVILELVDQSPGAYFVQTDTDRFMQVITNLVSNAIKFSPPQEKVVIRYMPDNTAIRIEVADRGKGIPQEFRHHIFEKFAQADSSDTKQKGGTGLGLSIAKAIIEQMKGRIGYETGIDASTVFFFTLPLAVRANNGLPVKKEENVVPNAKRILICEDDPDISHFLTLILHRAGFEVDVADNASDAMTELYKRDYMAMTLDLALPDKDGISFIRELRSLPKFMDLPIIVVSAKAEEGKKKLNGDVIGIIDWLIKPIDVNRLVDIVRNLHLKTRRPSILHVEDDKDIAEILRLALLAVADVTWTDYLAEAKELILRQRFDLVVLDIGLPDGKGTDLLPLLGSQGDHPIPVVLFTAAEIPLEISAQVTVALTKSRTSENKLLTTIKQLITTEAMRQEI